MAHLNPDRIEPGGDKGNFAGPDDAVAHVVIGIDGSDESLRAVRLVATIAWPAATRFHVVSVAPSWQELMGRPWMAVGPLNMDELERAEVDRVRTVAERAASELSHAGRRADATVVRGRPADCILSAASDRHADLIVVGSRGMGDMESALVGSVSSEIVDHAPCPVLVARSATLARSLIADDGSGGAHRALDWVAARPHLLGGHALVVGVVELPMLWPDALVSLAPTTMQMLVEARQTAADVTSDHIRARAGDLVATGIDAEHQVRTGQPAAELIATAKETGADLIVVGSHGRTGLARLALGSVSRNVLHHAPCSVLVVRPSPDRAVDQAVIGPAVATLVGT